MPVVMDADSDAAQAQARLEEEHRALLQEAQEMDLARQDFERSLREYNKVHGFTPVAKGPSRMNEVRDRGKRLNAEIEKDGRVSRTASVVSAGKLK